MTNKIERIIPFNYVRKYRSRVTPRRDITDRLGQDRKYLEELRAEGKNDVLLGDGRVVTLDIYERILAVSEAAFLKKH